MQSLFVRSSSLRSAASRPLLSSRSFTRSAVRFSEVENVGSRSTPASPAFYTARPAYYDQVSQLQKALSRSQAFLKANHLLPLPDFARASIPPIQPVWKDQAEMALKFQTKLTTTRYRTVTKLLNELKQLQQIASVAGCVELNAKLDDVLSMFESNKKEALLARGKRKPVVLDLYGRSYTLGKRKTSSARVWIIPTKAPTTSTPEQEFGLPAPQGDTPVSTTTILVNNLPLNEFFPNPADRERITRPLKVAGVLGKYNVFSIVRGGGTTGQSGALAHGIAKGLVAHEPELETMFRRAKLSRRDPRMVERKKTGRAKARKGYTWVKR